MPNVVSPGLVLPLAAAPATRSSFSTREIVTFGAVAVAALYFGREVFVPVALAVLLSFVLAPLVLFLRRWHLGRVPSVLAAVLLAAVVIAGLGALIGSQLAELADNLPQYQSTIKQKIHALRLTAGQSGGVVERATSMLKDLGDEIAKVEPAAPRTRVTASRGAPQREAVPVEVRQPDPAPLTIIQSVVGPLLGPLATTGIVIIFVIFVLLQREDLRDRFIRLAGERDLQRTTEALNDAGRRVSRYLLVQSAINASFGVVIGIGLWLIGVPNAVLWGVVAALLRFVPYIGPIMAAAFAAALAIAVDPGWSMLLWTVALFAVAEPITGQVVEPWLYGQSTGLSTMAVVVAATFWTWLWGPIGLLLSTPLTVCLVVLGRHVEHLQFIDIMLGDRPALTPEQSFYQRMLAGDPDEAADQAEAFLKEKPLSAYYDEVAIKGLALAQEDVGRGTLDGDGRLRISQAVAAVAAELADHDDIPSVAALDGRRSAPAPNLGAEELAADRRGEPVLCIAGRGFLDEAAAALLAQLLERHGVAARVVSSEAASATSSFRLDPTGVWMACASYLAAGGLSSARYLVRRLRRRLPGARIIIGFWTMSAEEAQQRDVLKFTGADAIAHSLTEAVEEIVAVARAAACAARPATKICADQICGDIIHNSPDRSAAPACSG